MRARDLNRTAEPKLDSRVAAANAAFALHARCMAARAHGVQIKRAAGLARTKKCGRGAFHAIDEEMNQNVTAVGE